MRSVRLGADAWDSCIWWQGQDRKTLKRIDLLIESAIRTPFEGTGKPEPLVGNLTGYWSRRIDEVNRLVYRATDDDLMVIGCRFHYGA